MENNKMYKRCSITVNIVEEREFEFLVPSHSVDKGGNIDNEILHEIEGQFEDGVLSVHNIEEEGHQYLTTNISLICSYEPITSVEDGETWVGEGRHKKNNLLIFGDDK